MERGIAKRYAKALFDLASSKEDLIRWKEGLNRLLQFLDALPELELMLKNPEVKESAKEALLKKCLSESDTILIRFFLLLLENKRLNTLIPIVREFYRLTAEAAGIVEARVITADPITEEIKKKIKEKLEISYGLPVALKEKVDPSLIGGAMVIVGHKLLDFSLKTRLARFKQHLSGA